MALDFERTFPRHKRALAFLLPDGWRGEVVDLSLVGLKIRSVAVLPSSEHIDGELVLEDGRKIALKCQVVWSTPPDPGGLMFAEAGLELIDVPDEYRRALADIFAE